jgi:hypothetical protein
VRIAVSAVQQTARLCPANPLRVRRTHHVKGSNESFIIIAPDNESNPLFGCDDGEAFFVY